MATTSYPRERQILLDLFVATLASYNLGPAGDTIARRLERSCFNKTVVVCEAEFIPRQWNNTTFTQRYSEECYRVIANLGPSTDGTLIKGLADGTIEPSNVSNMVTTDLSPGSTAAERESIEKRLASTIDKKYSNTPCKKCGEHKVMFVQVQTRAADELSSFHFKCDGCKASWGQ